MRKNLKKENKKQNNHLITFLNEVTDKTQNKEDFIKITSLCDKFKCSDYY